MADADAPHDERDERDDDDCEALLAEIADSIDASLLRTMVPPNSDAAAELERLRDKIHDFLGR